MTQARPANRTRPAGHGAADRAGLAEVARGSTLNLAGVIISAAATLGTTVIVAREFSRAVAGAFFTATSLFLIVEAVASLGAYNGAVYFIARLRSAGADRNIPAMLRAATWPVVVVSLLGAAALLVFAHPLARLLLGGQLGHNGATPDAVASVVRALAVTVPFAALLDTFLGASRGFRDMMPTVAIDRIGRSALQLLGLLAAAAAGSAALLAPLWSLPYIPASIAAWIWLRRTRHRALASGPGAPLADLLPDVPTALAALLALSVPVGPWPPAGSVYEGRLRVRASTDGPSTDGPSTDGPSTNGTGENGRARPGGRTGGRTWAAGQISPGRFWAFTAPRALATVAQIVIQRLDIVLVAILRGPAEAAIYAAATRFLVVGQLGNAAIIQAAQPQLSHLFAIGDRAGANTVYQATTAWLVAMTWPLYLLSIIYGPAILTIFGRSYQAGATVMVVLGLAMLLATACGQVDMVLTTAGRSSWSLANGLLAVVVNVAADLALIPRFGIVGAAIGWALAIAVTNLIPLAQVALSLRVHPFGHGLAAAIAVTSVAFAGLPLALRAVLGSGLPADLVAIMAGVLAGAAGLWRFRDALQLAVMPGLGGIIRRAGGSRSRARTEPG
jgi:O-antigen/teichoic acid export membrane protein